MPFALWERKTDAGLLLRAPGLAGTWAAARSRPGEAAQPAASPAEEGGRPSSWGVKRGDGEPHGPNGPSSGTAKASPEPAPRGAWRSPAGETPARGASRLGCRGGALGLRAPHRLSIKVSIPWDLGAVGVGAEFGESPGPGGHEWPHSPAPPRPPPLTSPAGPQENEPLCPLPAGRAKPPQQRSLWRAWRWNASLRRRRGDRSVHVLLPVGSAPAPAAPGTAVPGLSHPVAGAQPSQTHPERCPVHPAGPRLPGAVAPGS